MTESADAHTADEPDRPIVVGVDGDEATTVGGNEMRKIRVHDLDWRSDGGVVGFGTATTGMR